MPNDAKGNPTKRPKDRDDVIAEAALALEEFNEESVSILRER